MDLYVHFPFCRSKCAYCALHSRAGVPAAARAEYVQARADEIAARGGTWDTVYFGGGSPAFTDLSPSFDALKGRLSPGAEFTVELNPRDVAPPLLERLHAGGVNRISLGVQSLDDAVLEAMGRGVTARETQDAFRLIRAAGFGNAGLDLIAGYPGTSRDSWRRTLDGVCALEPVHASVYTLIREPATRLDRAVREGRLALPDADEAFDQFQLAERALASIGLERYEISSFARPGFACRHNLNTWRGGDYTGLGEGAHGREGLCRTRDGHVAERLSPLDDARERALFAFRLMEGVDLEATARTWPVLAPEVARWRETLEGLIAPGIVCRRGSRHALTPRGCEVCDAVLAELLASSDT